MRRNMAYGQVVYYVVMISQLLGCVVCQSDMSGSGEVVSMMSIDSLVMSNSSSILSIPTHMLPSSLTVASSQSNFIVQSPVGFSSSLSLALFESSSVMESIIGLSSLSGGSLLESINFSPTLSFSSRLPSSTPLLISTSLVSILLSSSTDFLVESTLSTTKILPSPISDFLSSRTQMTLDKTTSSETLSSSLVVKSTSVTKVVLPSTVIPNSIHPSSNDTRSVTDVPTIVSLSSASPSPTGTTPTNLLDEILGIFNDQTILLVVAVGGPCIVILLVAICVFCCCYCCRRKRRGRYSIEGQYADHSNDDPNQYRRHPSISNPIPSYKMALRNVQEQRQRIDDIVETQLGPESSIDDNVRYQGHSQVQHSQPYSPSSSEFGGTQTLSKLTPFNPSQIISQVKGGISVDEIDDDIPEKDDKMKQKQLSQMDDDDEEGRDSPFMHLSDNLSGSRGRISQRSSSDPHTELIGTVTQPSQASQYSHLGLGVLHGGDVVFTNTASLADDMQSSLGMVGIDKSLLLSRDSDLHSHRTASPLLQERSMDLDETPVREKSTVQRGATSTKSQKLKDLTSLTSLTSLEPARSSTPTDDDAKGKRLNLRSITSLSNSTDDNNFTHSDTVNSDLQETPERHRRHTVDSYPFKRNISSKPNQSKLGKLTSLEYIRASLRMKLNRIKRNDSLESNSSKKKPLKSALRKNTSTSSQNSSPDSTTGSRNNSFVYGNRGAYTQYNNGYSDVSPQHHQPNNPQHFHPPPHSVDTSYEYPPGPVMGGGTPDVYGAYNIGMYPSGPGYLRGPPEPYIVALSPPGYPPEAVALSPILSVSQFDHPGMYPSHEIGILPQYGMPPEGVPTAMMNSGYDQSFPPQPPHYDDDDDDIPALHSPYRQGDQGGGASQRNVTWNLEPVEIPVDPEDLTPSDIDDDIR